MKKVRRAATALDAAACESERTHDVGAHRVVECQKAFGDGRLGGRRLGGGGRRRLRWDARPERHIPERGGDLETEAATENRRSLDDGRELAHVARP